VRVLHCGPTLLAACVVGACAGAPRGLESKGDGVGAVLATLPDAATTSQTSPARPDRDAAIAAWSRVRSTLPDASDNQRIDRRLADLELDTEDPATQRAAIARYEALLASGDAAHVDELLYRLARANDLLGDARQSRVWLERLIEDHPESPHIVEARFRRAEASFSAEAYAAAAEDYAFVVEQGTTGAYWQNANYLLAWCLFKNGDYTGSLSGLFTAIDALLAGRDTLESADEELLDDALRAVVLVAGELEGARTVAEELARRGRPSWQHRVYEHLADTLRRQKRHVETVAALDVFLEQNPFDANAPRFAQRQIETLEAGGLATDARRYKERFVERYGVDSEYWIVRGDAEQGAWLPVLRAHLLEVAKATHHDAQQSGRRSLFVRAAGYYATFVRTFPADEAAPDVLFLLGEALSEAGDTEAAVAAYQRVMREHHDFAHAAEAGWAAVLGRSELRKRASNGRVALEQRLEIDAQIEFSALFPDARHADEARTRAAVTLFDLGEVDEADALAQRVLAQSSGLAAPLRRAATLIVAQSAFERAEFDGAEVQFARALAIGADADSVPPDEDVRARLAASIFRQGEVAERAGDTDAAVTHYLRIATIAPDSEPARRAHYDAVAVLERGGRLRDAASLLADFRARYPTSPLARDATPRLADLYDKSGQPRLAATEYRRVADGDGSDDPAVRRSALYRAGELYRDAGDARGAIDAFGAYCERHPDPPDLAMEALHELALAYEAGNDQDSRSAQWRRLISVARGLGTAISDRGRFLAANASLSLADEARRRFDDVHLSEPLAPSLARKRAALTETIAAYEATAQWGVGEITDAATFRIADTYAALASELLGSPRPRGLTSLESSQYEPLLEEQALPFEEQAIAIYEINVHRAWAGRWDVWIERSFAALRALVPGRFDKPEARIGHVDVIL
jgi:tetratricopeptide (TPR) repeat protein